MRLIRPGTPIAGIVLAAVAGALLAAGGPSVAAPQQAAGQAAAYDLADVIELRTIGSWAEGDRTIEARLVKLDTGLEEPRIAGIVDWVEHDFSERTKSVTAALPLLDCQGRAIGDFVVAEVRQREGEDVELLLRTLARSNGETVRFLVSDDSAHPFGCGVRSD